MNKNSLKKYFLTGFFSVLPIVITIKIFQWIFNFTFDVVSKSIVAQLVEKGVNSFYENIQISSRWMGLYSILIDILAIIITVGGVTILGYTLRHVLVEKIVNMIHKILDSVPLVNTIYNTVKQLIGMISGDKAETYKKVVLLEYPRKGIYSIGFLTSESNEVLEKVLNEEVMCNVFIPTSPNPTSGLFISAAKKELIILDIKVDDAVKLVISGGAIVPPYVNKTEG